MGDIPRIVRIGTHAVSSGSKATLRNRLRNHLGRADGVGSHRGSVFRLHVGRAMLIANNILEQFPSWGEGQNAPQEILIREQEHERRVTEYISRLEVFIIPINDEPSKNSLRAHVETQLIALFTEGYKIIDKPSTKWLGIKSPKEPIVRSGLWNLRDVGVKYIPNGVGSIDSILYLKGVFNHE